MFKFLVITLLFFSNFVFAFQGFGKTTGGDNFSTFHVTNLNDAGIGSLRDALSQSDRHIVFDVDGAINLSKPIVLNQINNITIDGTYNKSKNLNLQVTGNGIYLTNSHDIIFQNFRIHNAQKYGILISDNSYNIILDHMSIINSSQNDVEFGKNIDINNSANNITVSYSIIAYNSPDYDVLETKYKGLLITDNELKPVTKVALHHNLFYQNYQRSPEISSPGEFVMVNNIIYDWRSYGTRCRNGSSGNIIANYYKTRLTNKQKDALIITDDAGLYYVQNNFGVDENLIPKSKQSPSIVGNLPIITTQDSNTLPVTLPNSLGTLPHDSEDIAILDGIKK